ncbi:MAG: Lipopolysaccharide core biosynthesis glycosyltransferase [uncultured bacterium]|nr:MAG: Lipopolysaccharide core biosynthesis glycosyltransferase [uncultured bacterium]
MPTISAIIITKNEEKNIAACIDSVLWVDEIIVLDCGSTDQTQEICRKYAPKVKLRETDWPGFGEQKNRALALATSDWILSVDADERVTPQLKQEILQKLDNPNYVAYKTPRLNYFLGKPIRYCYGDKSDAPIRLAKKNACKFSDDIIHEKIIVNGTIGKLQNKLDHFSFNNIEDLINKINSYSTLGATKLYKNNKKTSHTKAFAHALWAFIRIYFLKRGFLDGWPGFIIAFSNFEGTFYRYVKLIEKNRSN